MYDSGQKQQKEKLSKVAVSQKEVRSEHENIFGKVYRGTKLKLSPSGSSNNMNVYSASETKCQKNLIFNFGEMSTVKALPKKQVPSKALACNLDMKLEPVAE